MRLSSGYEAKKARVEMLPLIDVVFLLLVFFIYAMVSMVVHHGITVALPSAGSAAMERDDYISITLDAENQLFLNAQPADSKTIAALVVEERGDAKKPVFIEGDRGADFGIAIELLDDLKQAGVEEVSFSCEQEAP